MGCLKLPYQERPEGLEKSVVFSGGAYEKRATASKFCGNYYPFGLQHSTSWTRITDLKNNFLYNAGSQLNEQTKNYETFYRDYDPALGRFNQIDPVAGKYASHTPYNYAFNDPVGLNDPMGDDVWDGWDDIFAFITEILAMDGAGGGYWGSDGTQFSFSGEGAVNGALAGYNNYHTGSSGFEMVTTVSGMRGDGGATVTGTWQPINNYGKQRIDYAKQFDGKWKYPSSLKEARGNALELDYEDAFCDCSEFFLRVLRETDPHVFAELVEFTDGKGRSWGNTTTIRDGIQRLGGSIRKDNPRVGDLVLWTGHVEFVERTANNDRFTIYGGGSGNIPRLEGIDKESGTIWLHPNYRKINTSWEGDFLGFWTPPQITFIPLILQPVEIKGAGSSRSKLQKIYPEGWPR